MQKISATSGVCSYRWSQRCRLVIAEVLHTCTISAPTRQRPRFEDMRYHKTIIERRFVHLYRSRCAVSVSSYTVDECVQPCIICERMVRRLAEVGDPEKARDDSSENRVKSPFLVRCCARRAVIKAVQPLAEARAAIWAIISIRLAGRDVCSALE